MPLPVLLALVVGGISGIALLLHLTGRSRRAVLDPETAAAAWIRENPGDDVVEATVSADGHAALILTRQGKGLVWAMGADTTARPLRDFDLIETQQGLTVLFRDFTAPRARIRLTDFERRRWLSLMDPT